MPNYIKDSSNNYTLYVDQGADYSIAVNATTFAIIDITGLTFFGSVKQHQNSFNSVEFIVTKNIVSNTILLALSNVDTQTLKQQRYQFDVFYKTATNQITRAFGGDVVVKNNISRE